MATCDSCSFETPEDSLISKMIYAKEEDFCPICRIPSMVSDIEKSLVLVSAAKYESVKEEIIENWGYEVFREAQNRAFKKLFAVYNS